jgi:hypothetical protein
VIPWWGWVALWSSLVLVLLIVLALAGWLLFRKFARVLDDLDDLAAKSDVLDGATDDAPVRAPVAILEPFSSVWQRRSARLHRRAERRTERRRVRLARARRIIAVDATTIVRRP